MDVSKIENVRPKGYGVRHAQTGLLFLGMLLAFTMRANMSMAIVDMTDVEKDQHFDWSPQIKSVILSAFFWGYVVLQIPGGELARRFGGKALVLTSVGVNALISMFIPLAAPLGGWQLVCVCRVLQGLTQAFVYPSTHHLISQWVPLEEKGLLTTIIYAGGQLGIALQLLVAGFLATAWGWQAIFYTNGTLGAIWTVAYFFLGSDSPEKSKLISPEELHYIQTSLGRIGEQKRLPAPWSQIMTSLPFWAVIVVHCGQNWGFFTLMTEMPTYMANVLGVNLNSNGVFSSLPYLMMYLLSFPMGAMTDLIIRKKWLNVTNCRKLFNSIGLWGPAIALIGLSYVPRGQLELAVIMLTLCVGINAGHYTGYLLVHIDLAPNFSASLMGITNFLANIISIIAPLVCGWIIGEHHVNKSTGLNGTYIGRTEGYNLEGEPGMDSLKLLLSPDSVTEEAAAWRKVFFLASGVYFFTNLFFILFATSSRQAWNEPQEIDIEMTAEKPSVETKK